jgi:hypothetical protein
MLRRWTGDSEPQGNDLPSIGLAAQFLFIAWLVVVNISYFGQFSGLLLSHLGRWIRQWH